MLPCRVCGGSVVRKSVTGPDPTYCSQLCRSRGQSPESKARQAARRIERRAAATKPASTCVVCDTPFARIGFAKTCSPTCSSVLAGRRTYTGECSVEACARVIRAKGLCVTHYNQTQPGRHKASTKGDSEIRRRNYRKQTARRRALLKDPNAEMIDRDVVGDRDGWRCGICQDWIDWALPYPAPESPSLDHVLPLSLGGHHVYANVRITHLACNVLRGNKIEAA